MDLSFRTTYRFLSILVLVLVIGSCTREIPYKQDNFKPVLVLKAIWEEGDSLELELTSSIGILDDTNQVFVTNAQVGIRTDALTFNVVEFGNGRYGSTAVCKPGKNYKITALADGFNPISASENVPNRIVATLPDSTETVINTDLINIDISDPEEVNYYMLEVKAKRYKYTFDPKTFEFDSALIIEPIKFGNLNKIFLSDLEIVSKETSFELFDDRIFNGKKYTLQVEIPASESRRSVLRSEVHYYVVSLKSISASYFQFLRNYLIARPVYGGPFESYREVPSNVDGGSGIFGLYTVVRDTVFVKE